MFNLFKTTTELEDFRFRYHWVVLLVQGLNPSTSLPVTFGPNIYSQSTAVVTVSGIEGVLAVDSMDYTCVPDKEDYFMKSDEDEFLID